MSVGEPGADGGSDKSSSGEPPARSGIWQSTKRLLLRSDAEISYFKGLTFVGLISTLIVAYFQYLSAYHDKVTAMAKDDMAFATDTFKHAAALKASGDANALTSNEAHDLYTAYEAAATALRQNGNLLARKVEIYLDWASDPNHDPANNDTLGADPISTSLLGAVDFDCDQDMPSFDKKDHVISKKKDGKTVDIDWYSAKHHVVTIEYCFDVTQKTWMEIVRQWASQSSTDPDQIAQFASSKTAVQLEERLSKEVVRLNDYMIRAMSEIEQIRVKYRPNGFVCSVPGVGQFLGLFRRCAPVHTAGP